jgi:hypothetical protein
MGNTCWRRRVIAESEPWAKGELEKLCPRRTDGKEIFLLNEEKSLLRTRPVSERELIT